MIYKNENLNEISFPLGGIGTGSIGLAGNGHLVEFEIFNRPDKGTLNDYTHFAVKAELPNGKSVIKVLQGDVLHELSGRYQKAWGNGFGNGIHQRTMAGFPHFRNVTFNGKFPIAELTFTDDDFPGEVVMTAFNPFIPLDSENSSLPAAFFDIKIKNFDEKVKYSILFTVANPYAVSRNTRVGNAIFMENAEDDKDSVKYGDLTVAIDKEEDLIVQQYWYRGAWGAGITSFWRELTDGNMKDRVYDAPGKRDLCTLGHFLTLSENEVGGCKFVLSWNVPNNYNYWSPREGDKPWKNYYATKFDTSLETANYSIAHFDEFYSKTDTFRKSLFNSTLDDAVKDAISGTISVLKSPTVWRLEDGTFYGWEGSFENAGSCEGTCTHVWSYTYALCFLFPDLERSLRECEFKYDVAPSGEMTGRTLLPLGGREFQNEPHIFCVDGQMATVFKVYRDFKITGNLDWLKDNWETVKSILEFAWSKENSHEWDLDCDGVLEGRQHHTLDQELFGPSSWLEGMYLLALKAAAEMAKLLGDTEALKKYTELFENGYKYTKENLFNGNYFFHKVDLTRKEYAEHFDCPQYWSEEKGQLVNQIGEGSSIDQMLAQFHSNICGLGDIFDKEQRKTALMSMYKNNFKKSLRNFANMWRVFALNDEAGTIICDYPEGANKPIIPVWYSEECMTGFEYAFAGLLISEGFIEEGLSVVRAVRDRYDGKKRNPWNEFECGSNYARSMASFALIPIFSGFEFDMLKKHIGFKPLIPGDFKCLWSLECAWGDYIKEENVHKIVLNSGEMALNSIRLKDISKVTSVCADGCEIEFLQDGDTITFNAQFKNELIIK